MLYERIKFRGEAFNFAAGNHGLSDRLTIPDCLFVAVEGSWWRVLLFKGSDLSFVWVVAKVRIRSEVVDGRSARCFRVECFVRVDQR